MQRKLMAVAVAGVFAAPAIALAQSSTVQLYGRITYEYGYADQGDGKPNTDVAQTPGGSALGVRGEEKLGGGLSAWFQCETSTDVRAFGNSDGLCTRNSAIGFKGGWGNLHFGRWDSPMKRAINMGWVGAKDTGLLGGSFVFSGSSTGTGFAKGDPDRNVWKRREAGLTYYESPKFSGAQVLAAFSPGNAATSATNATTAAKPRLLSIAGTYKNGPISFGLAYEQHQQVTGVGGKNDDSAWTIAGSYTFMNKIEVGAAYLDAKYETSSTTDLKKKNWLLGVDWKVAGPHSAHFAWVQAGESKGNSLTGISGASGGIAASGPDTGADWWSIAYEYAFSKRTNARIGYVHLSNDSNASYGLGGLTVASAGQDQSAIVLYLEHNF